MRLYLNSDSSGISTNKKQYLIKAANKIGIPLAEWTQQIGAGADYVLNIEPFGSFVKGKIWTGIWEIDILLDRQEMSESNWEHSDRVFIAVSTIPDRLEKFRDKTRLLLQAIDPEIHRRKPDIKVEYDVVFAGAMHSPVYTERERIYSYIKTFCNYKGFDNNKPIEEYVNIMNLAEVQFIRSMKTPIGDGELAQRFFESLAIGPVLTNYVDDLKHTGLVHEEDYFYYRDDKDMLEKLSYLIKHPEFASKMALNGRRKALMHHTYGNRLVTILDQIEEDTRG